MAGTKEIRTKIKSVQNTRKITKAMEMVAASKMRKAQERMRLARPFAAKIRSVRPPEPYKGKGIAYEGEFIRRKAGKTGK